MSALRLQAVRKRYGDLTALDGIDLAVAAGKIHAIIGLNGVGKTTLMRAVVGQLRADDGTIDVLGSRLPNVPREVWGRVGHVIGQPFAYPELTVRENIVASARLRDAKAGQADAAATAWIERLSLGRWADRRSSTLSLGNRQRLGLAAVAVMDPDLLILDEPTSALDPAGVLALREVIVERAGAGAGVLVSSHHLDEVARVAAEISVVHRGRVIGRLDPGGAELERALFAMVRRHDEEHPPGPASGAATQAQAAPATEMRS